MCQHLGPEHIEERTQVEKHYRSRGNGPLFLTAHVRSEIREIPEVQVTERIREQIVPERNGVQIRKIPVPPIVEQIVEVVQVVLHEHLQQRTVEPQIQEQIVGNIQAIP